MKRIDRTLFWFYDENGPISDLTGDFLGLSTLLNRLLNERYEGARIRFINLDFSSLMMQPNVPKSKTHYYGGHLRYYGVFDLAEFSALDWKDKIIFVWENGCKNLIKSSEITGNISLLKAAKYAYEKGKEINLNPDFKVVETSFEMNSTKFKAYVWISFKKDGMFSRLIVENSSTIIFEKNIGKSRNGIEFFLDMYKGIEFKKNFLIVKGPKDAGFPLKTSFNSLELT